jgi:hypothetical protein
MDRAAQGVVDPRIGEPPSQLFIYLFVWDRYRMVAKDFTLQQSALRLSPLWVECHERMARWFILMDHKMQSDGTYCYSLLSCPSPVLSCVLSPFPVFYFCWSDCMYDVACVMVA